MTSFNISENIQQVEDPAMNNCSGPILVDASSLIETYVVIASNTAATTDNLGVRGYNGIETIFQTDISPATRVRLDKSFLNIEYTCGNFFGGAPGVALVGGLVSIPWNTIAATLERCSYALNVANIDIENHTSYFGHGNMIKLLSTYSARALEAASDRFFTPCIEEYRDFQGNAASGLSAISTQRAQDWLQRAPPATKKKVILLADLFDSMRAETCWYIQRLVLRLYFKQPDNILFKGQSTDPQVPKFYITDVKLHLCINTLSADQIDIERAKVESNESMMRNAYRIFDVITVSATSQQVYQQPAIKNLQAATMMISSPMSNDGLQIHGAPAVGKLVGVNPYQYCYGCTFETPATGVVNYHQRYDNYYSPMALVTLGTIPNHSQNTELYQYWRYMNRLVGERHEEPTISFGSMANTLSATIDHSTYAIFASSFTNTDTAPRKLVAGGTHEIRITNNGAGGNNYQVILVRLRMGAIEITGDTQIHMMI